MTFRSGLRLAATAGLVIAMGCHRHRDWDRAGAFERELKCGMPVAVVEQLAPQLGASGFAKPELAGQPSIPDYYVAENERLISLWFDERGHLTAYMSAISSMEHDEESAADRRELCLQGQSRIDVFPLDAESNPETAARRSAIWSAEASPPLSDSVASAFEHANSKAEAIASALHIGRLVRNAG
jgi:hypothetical protein